MRCEFSTREGFAGWGESRVCAKNVGPDESARAYAVRDAIEAVFRYCGEVLSTSFTIVRGLCMRLPLACPLAASRGAWSFEEAAVVLAAASVAWPEFLLLTVTSARPSPFTSPAATREGFESELEDAGFAAVCCQSS